MGSVSATDHERELDRFEVDRSTSPPRRGKGLVQGVQILEMRQQPLRILCPRLSRV